MNLLIQSQALCQLSYRAICLPDGRASKILPVKVFCNVAVPPPIYPLPS